MNHATTGLIAAVLAAAGVAAGYVWGTRAAAGHTAGPADMAGAPVAGARPAAASAPRRILYYRNPMGQPDTSPVPKKDPMGMDYLPVYEGGDEPATASGAPALRFSAEKVQLLGVRTEAAALRPLGQVLRVPGRVEADERRTHVIAPRFGGFVERLHVNVSGQAVTRGQPLFDVYSPELVAAQREYAIAMQGVREMEAAGGDAAAATGMRPLAEASLLRLRNWDLSVQQIETLARSGEVRRTLSFASPVSGIVTEKRAVQGMRFMPGDTLYQVTDLSTVWVMADVPEHDIAALRPGARAAVRIDAYPGQVFTGTLGYIYPTLKADTRSVPVRVELPNPGGRLKPAMFAQVELALGSAAPVLTVPDSAVIDSGTRQLAFVQRGEGRFEARELRLGARSDSRVQVLDGLREGELVVVQANFLLDAESNLRAAIGGLGTSAPAASAASAAAAPQGRN